MRHILLTLKEMEEAGKKKIGSWSKEDFIQFFEKTSIVKRGGFAKYKMYTIQEIEKMDIPNKSDVIEEVRSITFRDINTLDTIDKIYFFDVLELKFNLDAVIKHYAAPKSQLFYSSIRVSAYCAFIGVYAEDAINIKTSDVATNGSSVTIKGQVYYFPREVIEDVMKHLELVNAQANTEWQSGVEDAYFIQPQSEAKYQEVDAFLKSFSRLNNQKGLLVDKVFKYERIRDSGKFLSIMNEERVIGPLYQISENGAVRSPNLEIFKKYFPTPESKSNPMYHRDIIVAYDMFKQIYRNKRIL